MDALPNDIILEIFNNITVISDKRNFIRTCKTYNNITKQLMNQIKYCIFDVYCDYDGNQHYNLISICNNLDDCRQCMFKFQQKYSKVPINKKNYYAIFGNRNNDVSAFDKYPRKGFLIEEMILNEI